MDKTSLGDRMKSYENVNRMYLIPNTPTLIRIDGKAFHSFTKGFNRPYDEVLMKAMNETARYLCKNIMGCKLAYVQSDEITLLLTDYDTYQTQSWFGGNIQKIASVSSSMATMAFNRFFEDILFNTSLTAELADIYYDKVGIAMFDSRVFQLPKEEVVNNFIWRQQDATRNSVQLVGFTYFSNKEMYKKSCSEVQDMLMIKKEINWNGYSTDKKRGRCIIKESYTVESEDGKLSDRSRWVIDTEIPIFTQNRDYIENLVYVNR